MNNGVDFAVIDRILDRHGAQASNVIAILQDIQGEYRYLPREIFPYLARKLQMSAAKIYSVATFYENFSLEPKGKYVIKICDGTACHVRKSIPILEKMRKLWAFPLRRSPPMICSLPWRPSPVWEPAVWPRPVPSTTKSILP